MGKKKTFPYKREDGHLLMGPPPGSLGTLEIRGYIEEDGSLVLASWVEGAAGGWNGEEINHIGPAVVAGLREWFQSA